ncbi:hypothetical protein DAD186_04610 [Dermabacter vaginalis]|uniref:Uncharacterized protein n=1 Tax=Dermabacter vaginalis TaxID=1630135 RepID=A0A1B0ZGI3_9MICO|nr:hypothetical protein DAD186_04610 [Dermabacter vaginalis]
MSQRTVGLRGTELVSRMCVREASHASSMTFEHARVQR